MNLSVEKTRLKTTDYQMMDGDKEATRRTSAVGKRSFILSAVALSFVLASCTTIRPTVSRLGDNTYVVDKPLTAKLRGGQTITVPRGFITDLASIPHFLEFIESKSGPTLAPGIVHDYLYWNQECTREQADAVLLLELKDSGVSNIRRYAIYGAVRSFLGEMAYEKNGKALKNGELRFISEAYLEATKDNFATGNPKLKDIQSAVLKEGGLKSYKYPDLVGIKAACEAALKTVAESSFFD